MTNVVSLPASDAKSRATGRATVVAALDIGSSKITCVIAEWRQGAKGYFRIIGHGQTASRGVSAGAINNLDEAEKAIRLAVDAAEKAAQVSISDVVVGVTGGKPQSHGYKGTVAVKSGVVEQADVDRAISAAVAQAVVGKRSVLSVSPSGYVLDGIDSEQAPIGMNGRSFSISVNLVTVDAPYLLNLAAAVERSHLIPSGFVLSANAAGRMCLEDDERSMGAAIVDIGSAVTSIGIFRKGRLQHGAALGVAGQHITQDIAKVFSTSLASAERLKTLHGSVLGFGDDERDILAIPQIGEKGLDSIQHIPKSKLTAVIRPRVEEILEMVEQHLRASGQVVEKIVITGGSASLVGLRELAKPVFGCDARIGHIPQLTGLAERARQPSLAVALGLLSHAVTPDPYCALPSAATAAIESQQLSRLRRVGRWIAESF
jgi:cell division protein FtsA